MSHFIKVVYENVRVDSRGFLLKEIKESLIKFKDEEYINSISYNENMENLIGLLMETGYFTLESGEIIPIFRICSFIPHNIEQNNQPIPIKNQQQNQQQNFQQKRSENKKYKRRFSKQHQKHFSPHDRCSVYSSSNKTNTPKDGSVNGELVINPVSPIQINTTTNEKPNEKPNMPSGNGLND